MHQKSKMNSLVINLRNDVLRFVTINQVNMQPLYNNSDDNTGVEENTKPSPTITHQQQERFIPSATTTTNQTSNSLVTQFFDRYPDPASTFAPQIEQKLLPIQYQPSEYDVTSGRGRGNYNQNGNKQFRCIVLQYVDEYMSKRSKSDKTHVLEKIVIQVQKQNCNTTKFVQYNSKNKRWYELSHDQAREKVGHVIRAMTQQSSSTPTTTTTSTTINTTLNKVTMEIVSDTLISQNVASVPSEFASTATVGTKQATLLQQQTSMFQNMLKRSCDCDTDEDDSKVDRSSINQSDMKKIRKK